MRALILVDIQNDFISGGALAVPKGDEVIAVANRVMPNYEFAVATQDWHPADGLSFASQHAGQTCWRNATSRCRPADGVELAL